MGEHIAGSKAGAVLMAGDADGERVGDGGSGLSRLPILGAVLRRSFPRLLEASLIPSLLFYLGLVLINAGAAMIAVICWSYGAVVRRLVNRQAIPAVLLLAIAGLTVRTALALLSGSEVIYFLQPIATTVVVAALFMGSLLVGRPLVARLAGDFCPLSPDVLTRPAVARLFTGLTVLWAGVYVASAVMTLTLLTTMPLAAFVATKTVVSLVITGAAVFVTVSCSLRTARREGLVFGRPLVAVATVPASPLAVVRPALR